MSDKLDQGISNDKHEAIAMLASKLASKKRKTLTVPHCPYCEEPMLFRHGGIHEKPKAWGQNWKCPECFLIDSFGIPLTEDEYKEVLELQNGNRHYNGKPSEDLKEKKIKRNLKDLGYLEM